jgi:hypothetical protein
MTLFSILQIAFKIVHFYQHSTIYAGLQACAEPIDLPREIRPSTTLMDPLQL